MTFLSSEPAAIYAIFGKVSSPFSVELSRKVPSASCPARSQRLNASARELALSFTYSNTLWCSATAYTDPTSNVPEFTRGLVESSPGSLDSLTIHPHICSNGGNMESGTVHPLPGLSPGRKETPDATTTFSTQALSTLRTQTSPSPRLSAHRPSSFPGLAQTAENQPG